MRETIMEGVKVDKALEELTKYLKKHELDFPNIRKKNYIRIVGNIALVYIRSKIHKDVYFVIDLKYLSIIEKFKWFYKDGYAVTTIVKNKRKKNIRMHRLIMCVLDSPKIEIDHINGDKNDNRECNLRVCIKGKDADNQANVNLHFEFPEIVDLYYWSEHNLFIMEVSDGLYDKVNIPYLTYEELLNDRQFLYENGMNNGLPHVLYQKKEELFIRLDSLTSDSDEFTICEKFIMQIFNKKNEALRRANLKNMSSLLGEAYMKMENLEVDRPYFLQDGTVFIIPSGRSSKEKYYIKSHMRIESNIQRDLTKLEEELVGGVFHESES